MEKQREDISKLLKAYAPFILVAVIGLIYHLKLQPMAADDIFFSRITEGRSIWEYLADRYQNWTSRIVIEFLLVIIVKYPLLWKLLDFLIFATFPMLLSKIFGRGRLMDWCAAGAVLLYPFHDMGSAGWITTTMNYFWPLWGIFFVGMLIKKMLVQERIKFPEAVLGAAACLVASSHEQAAVLLFVVLLLYVFALWRNKRKISNKPVFAVLAAANVFSLVSILLCPGNSARNQVSIADLPVFEEFNFGDKLYLGLLSIERVFIANADIVFLSTVLILAILVYRKTDHYGKTMIAGIPLLLLFGQTVVRTAYPGLSGIFVVPKQITSWSWNSLSTWIPMVFLALTVLSMLYALYQLLGENLLEYIYALLLLGCGFGAGVVLGFVATIYVSGERVYITLYFILLFISMLCIYKMRDRVREWLKQTGGKLVLTVFALLCLVNVGFVFLSC